MGCTKEWPVCLSLTVEVKLLRIEQGGLDAADHRMVARDMSLNEPLGRACFRSSSQTPLLAGALSPSLFLFPSCSSISISLTNYSSLVRASARIPSGRVWTFVVYSEAPCQTWGWIRTQQAGLAPDVPTWKLRSSAELPFGLSILGRLS